MGNKNIHTRQPSHKVLPLLQNDFFDAMYIDGNQNTSSMLEDSVLCDTELKPNGYSIMDYINWGNGEEDTHNTVCILIFANALTKIKMLLIFICNTPVWVAKNHLQKALVRK